MARADRTGRWQASSDPAWMLTALGNRASQRKLRLLCCACFRVLYGDRARDRRTAAAVETAQRYADARATKAEVVAARRELTAAREGSFRAKRAAWWATFGRPRTAIRAILNAECPPPWRYHGARPRGAPGGPLPPEQQAIGAQLLREVFANPFRPIGADSQWQSWEEGTIPKLARRIYDEGAFERLPILADALEEAGCTNADILNHCRQPSEHVRGCWVIDLILGKE